MKSALFLVILSAVAPAQNRVIAPPAQNLPMAADLPAQTIRPNDLLAISVYNQPELACTVRVGADGMIRLPLLTHKIKAGGAMAEELAKTIGAALIAEEILVAPDVTVIVTEYHQSLPISVVGAVKAPLTFRAVGTTVTLVEALTRAGGLTPEAGPEILISPPRGEADGTAPPPMLIKRVFVKDLIDIADPSVNLTLEGGEEIRVPEMGKVYAVGNVKKPGAFMMQNSGMSVIKLMALVEGLSPYSAKEAYIYRREAGAASQNEIPVDLRNIMDRKAPDVPLLANDILYVPDNHKRRTTMTALDKIFIGVGGVALSAMIYTLLR